MADLNFTDEQIRRLARTAPIAYTCGGYLPQEAVWRLKPEEVAEIVMRNSLPFLNDIVQVEIDTTPMPGKDEHGNKIMRDIPVAYVWLKKDSPNLVDKSLENTDAAVKFSISSPSDELKEYYNKFGTDPKLRVLDGDGFVKTQGRTKKESYGGVVVFVDRFIKLEFDAHGNDFAKKFGHEFKVGHDVFLNFIRDKSQPDRPITEFIITKSVCQIKNDTKIKPRKSRNFY